MGESLKIKLNPSRSLRAVVRDIMTQAQERQRKSSGVYQVSAVLQHLVGAALECMLVTGKCAHNTFSTIDAPGAGGAAFFLGDVAIYVTASPGEAIIAGCGENISEGFRPIVVTLPRGLLAAEGLAENVGLGDRIDIFDIEQFVTCNLYRWAKFGRQGYKTAITNLVNRYNEIVETVETDPSLKIELRQ